MATSAASQLPSAGLAPGAYVVSSGNAQLIAGEPGQPVVLSAASTQTAPWFIVPDDRPAPAGPGATLYILISAKETFLAKTVDVDSISTTAERAQALSLEILPAADGSGAYKLVVDGLVLSAQADGNVELRAPDSGDDAAQLWQLTAGATTQQAWVIMDPRSL